MHPCSASPRKGGGYRVCLDYRALSSKAKEPAGLSTTPEDCIRNLNEQGARSFIHIDFRNDITQTPIAKSSRRLTAFTVPGAGQFQ